MPRRSGIGQALFHQPGHPVADVVLHLEAPLLEAGLPEGLAIAGGAPKIHLQHRQTPVGQELDFGVETPVIPGPGAAVGIDHHRQVFGRRLLWAGSDSREWSSRPGTGS